MIRRLLGDSFKAKHDGGTCVLCALSLRAGQYQAYVKPGRTDEYRVHYDCAFVELGADAEPPPKTQYNSTSSAGKITTQVSGTLEMLLPCSRDCSDLGTGDPCPDCEHWSGLHPGTHNPALKHCSICNLGRVS